MNRWTKGLGAFVLLGLAGCSSLGGAKENTPVHSLFETRPPGASLFVNGGFVGTTPVSFYLPPRERVEIRLEKPGHSPQEDTLIRRRNVPPDAEEGVGWESNYYYELRSR